MNINDWDADGEQWRQLRQLIQVRFDLEELQTLCYDLAVDFDEMAGQTKSAKVRSLILHMAKNGRLPDLLTLLQKERPYHQWPTELPLETIEALNRAGHLVGVPSLPAHHLSRQTELAKLKAMVMADAPSPVAIVGQLTAVGLQGMGGIGKTVLATALAYDEGVQQQFPDGIFWLTIGQNPDILALQMQLGHMLGRKLTIPYESLEEVRKGSATKVEKAIQEFRILLKEVLADKTCLLILDDVWQIDHARAFYFLNAASRIVLTARNASLMTALGAVQYPLDALEKSEALALLASWTDQSISQLPDTAAQVAHECGYLPLALAICGALVQDGILWDDLLAALMEADLSFLEHQHLSVMRSIQVSLDALPEEIARAYITLAIFPEDTFIPEKTISIFWKHLFDWTPRDSRRYLSILERRALLKMSGGLQARHYFLHDLHYLYIKQVIPRAKEMHRKFLAAYYREYPPGRSSPQDTYFFQHFAYHSRQGGKKYINSRLSLGVGYFITLSGITAILPLLLVLSLLIKLESPGPILYRHRVVGLHGRRFNLYRFRTTIGGKEKGSLVRRVPPVPGGWQPVLRPDLHPAQNRWQRRQAPRITRVGAVLRKTSLDMLPSLINVLAFDIALVGPRIMSIPELEACGEYGDTILMALPGLTGVWQTNRVYPTSYDEKLRHDLEYIYNCSFLFDMKLLLQTIPALLKEEAQSK